MGFSIATFVALALLAVVSAENAEPKFRMCVPFIYYQDCLTLLGKFSEGGVKMECVQGRDRIECLDMIHQGKADVLAAEPEDMYVAYHTKNKDYKVISEIRTEEDKDAPFRYEGIILVKKNSNIHSLKELRGAKSCHTGFGRNVGYKIPITKLKNDGVLEVSKDPELTATERELKALSEFFSQSCLVGTYSPYAETDQMLKKKYSNLCALCEKPEQCNYPDKFSGYDGAIRCLDKGKGEVAFTKVQFIKKYFGLIPGVKAEGDPSDFEYLCEDGSRRPLDGPACSWAQRPWSGYIANSESIQGEQRFHNLQNRLEKFFENAVRGENKGLAPYFLINKDAVYYKKPEAVDPQEYLEKAGYKDVIERDGSELRKMRLCVQSDIEFDKCNAMQRAAYSRDIRPEIECVREANCISAVAEGRADMLAVPASQYKAAREAKLEPIVYEAYDDNDVYVVLVDPKLTKEDLKTKPVFFDPNNIREAKAAAYLYSTRGLNECPSKPGDDKSIQIFNARNLGGINGKILLCPDGEEKPLEEWEKCNFEANLPNAVFIRDSMTPVEKETLKHLFISLSDKFGKLRKLTDVFQLFGNYAPHYADVLFRNEAVKFVTELEKNKLPNEEFYQSLPC